MRRRNSIFSNKKKRNDGPKKVVLAVLIGAVVIVGGFKGVTATTAFIEEKRIERIEKQKKAEAERLAAEKKRKEEEEAKKRMVGVTNEGKKYTYDARKIWEKLNSGDYSNDGKKMVFLTFDDGSSTTVTPEILKILKANDVRATFFVTGENIERGGKAAEDLIKQSFEYGNAIANHSWSHDYHTLYPNRTLPPMLYPSLLYSFNALLKRSFLLLISEEANEAYKVKIMSAPAVTTPYSLNRKKFISFTMSWILFLTRYSSISIKVDLTRLNLLSSVQTNVLYSG